MKLFMFILVIFICCTIVFFILSLIYPIPAAFIDNNPPDIDESYFFNKILSNHIGEDNENRLTVTEEELSGYINYRLKQQTYQLQRIAVKHGEVKLLDQMIIFTAYGDYGRLPVRIEAHLIPYLQEDNIVFEIQELKLSRIRIPKELINKLYANSQYTIPLEELGIIKIESLIVIDGEAIIGYSVDKKRILEEIIKSLSKQSN